MSDGDDLLMPRTAPCTCQKTVIFLTALRAANVPREFWEIEEVEFEWNQAARARVEEYTADLAGALRAGAGFLMTGRNGVGKTSCACVILARAARAGRTVAYMTSHDFITSAIPASRDAELESWRHALGAADFLVLDEVGKEHRAAGSEYALSELDSLLRWRRGENKPTVICTNFDAREFATTYGDSLWSAIRDRLEVLKFRDGDFRTELKRRRGSE
jgi:DNA replication protein DnaC